MPESVRHLKTVFVSFLVLQKMKMANTGQTWWWLSQTGLDSVTTMRLKLQSSIDAEFEIDCPASYYWKNQKKSRFVDSFSFNPHSRSSTRTLMPIKANSKSDWQAGLALKTRFYKWHWHLPSTLTGAITFSHICSPPHHMLAAVVEEPTHLNSDSITLAAGSHMKAIESPFALRSLSRWVVSHWRLNE